MPATVKSLDELLDRVGSLPPMPLVARRATEIIRNPKSSMADLANVIKLDQSISALILRWVNSAYYALRAPVVSIEQAVTMLGQRTVQNLVLSASVASLMGREIPGYALERGMLWKRAVGTAAGARLIAQDVAPTMAEDAYFAGLFCDVGKLILDVVLQNSSQNYESIGRHTFQEFEIALVGYDHAAISAAMARRWSLPEHLVKIIANHHSPAKVNGEWLVLAYAVHAADAAMMMLGIGVGVDGLHYLVDPETTKVLNWSEGSFERLVNRVLPIIEEAEAFLKK